MDSLDDYTNCHSANLADGPGVARLIETVFRIQPSLIVIVISITLMTRNLPVLTVISLLKTQLQDAQWEM